MAYMSVAMDGDLIPYFLGSVDEGDTADKFYNKLSNFLSPSASRISLNSPGSIIISSYCMDMNAEMRSPFSEIQSWQIKIQYTFF